MVTKAQQDNTVTQPGTRNLYQRIHAARAKFTPIVKNKVNPHFKSRFADLDSVVSAVEQALSDEGVLVVGLAQPSTETQWLIGIRLVNIDNPEDSTAQYIPSTLYEPQKQGIAITYARRYLLCLMLNLLTDEDNDGNITSSVETKDPVSYTSNSDW